MLTALPVDGDGAPAVALRAVIRAVAAASGGALRLVFDPTLVRGMSLLHRADLRDQLQGPALLDRGRRPLRPHDRAVPRPGRPGLRLLDRLRADHRHPPGAGRRRGEPAQRLALIVDRERDDLAEVAGRRAAAPRRGSSRLPRGAEQAPRASSWTTSPPRASAAISSSESRTSAVLGSGPSEAR